MATATNIIDLKDISVTFKTHDQTVAAVQDVDLTVEKGDIYGSLGIRVLGRVLWCG